MSLLNIYDMSVNLDNINVTLEKDDSNKVVNKEQETNNVVVSENTVHAIIQIDDSKIITVLDAIPDGKSLDTTRPYDLLANKTPSIFAIKIVKKDKCSTPNENNKCIDFCDSHYEMDLSTPVITVDKLLNQDFLSTSTETNGTNESNATGSDVTESNATGSNATRSNANESNANESNANESNATGSNATGSDVTESNATGSDVTESNATGGSRKNLRQKSKKTKRKYYVYKK